MHEPIQSKPQLPSAPHSTSTSQPESNSPAQAAGQQAAARRETRRWWMKLCAQPLIFLACGAVLLTGLGAAQRMGWISSGGISAGGHDHGQASGEHVTYICPMMCTPPQSEPGRCPVCAMELVPSSMSNGPTDSRSVHLDPAARRVANIQTVAVKSVCMMHTIRSVGQLSYNEGTLKTISAYVDGRIERLYADYTGVVVTEGDHLALVYSPDLYSAQTEYLEARRSLTAIHMDALPVIRETQRRLVNNSRQRLIELGVTGPQVEQLEQTDAADSRMHLCAPISGTVIEKHAVEGQYVQQGEAIYELADLSTVWLVLELFPEDAATIRYGQRVDIEVQSFPGRVIAGRVAFINPNVDPQSRTVGVRVVMQNDAGILRIGDYAKATIQVPVGSEDRFVYDPELANLWVSPRHPHIVSTTAGHCPICGIDLVPAVALGFTDQPIPGNEALVVPRNAVLMAGNNSVVYVETEPGRFEIRRVVLGPRCGDDVVIRRGVEKGEHVATRGNFLIDSQMQLAGNPSLIDPTKAEMRLDTEMSAATIAALSDLSHMDRQLAEAQRICPVTRIQLGSMGTPLKVDVDGLPVFICCQGCEARLLEDPQTYLVNLQVDPPFDPESVDDNAEIHRSLSALSPADRALAERQRICPVADYLLGAMGTPIKVDVNGTPVFICCEGCRDSLLADPETYLAKLTAPIDTHSPAADHPADRPPTVDFEIIEIEDHPSEGVPPREDASGLPSTSNRSTESSGETVR